MKTKYTRLLSLLLVLVLVIGLVPPVSAAGTLSAAGQLRNLQSQSAAAGTGELPDPIRGHHPLIPDDPYPYGLPCEARLPDEILMPNPYAISMMAEGQGNIPDEMWDNAILRALEYTGYDLQKQKDNGQLYCAQYIGSALATNDPGVLSDIGYYVSGYCPNGDETVDDPTTVTGKAPDISFFEDQGLVCASFVTYFLCNYLPNIEGVDTSVIYEKVKEVGVDTRNEDMYYLTSPEVWALALDQLVAAGTAGVTKYTDADTAYDHLVPGDVILFDRDGDLTHIAIYAGEYDMISWGSNFGKYQFIIHVGNARGPEISTVRYMTNAGNKSSEPIAWYHLDLNEDVQETGFIEIYKRDPAGMSLAGARFKAVNQATGDTYYIGPTDAAGYARSGELPLGTYEVTETVFPDGYESSGQSTWTVTLTSETPNNTITIEAVNQQIKGSLTIRKTTNTGLNLDGWRFGVYTNAACTSPIPGSPFTTDTSGVITITGLEPGTYYVKELSGQIDFWITDQEVRAVAVRNNTASTVTVNNINYGYGKIIKKTNTGGSLSGWKFNIFTDAACTQTVDGSPFTTDAEGVIVKDLLPGTYYVQEVDESDTHPDWDYDTTVRTLTVTPNTTQSVTFTNHQYGYARIVKTTNTGENLDGWKFQIYTDAACTSPVDGAPFVSGADGTITARIAPGTYYIREVDESASRPGWIFDTELKTVSVTAGQTASVTFTNRQLGSAKIIKTTNTGEDLGGWKFNICTDAACTKPVDGSPFTTDASGLIVRDLLPGTYYVQEVDESSARPGWVFDREVRTVTVKAGHTASVTFTNRQYGIAKIVKTTNTGENLDGWKFNIYTDAACTKPVDGSPFTTDAAGIIAKVLLPGTYYVREVDESASKPGWVFDLEVRTVAVAAGQTATVTFTNHQYAHARIIKKTNTGENLGGWKFQIYTDAACTLPVEGSPFVSGEDGTITARLEPGTYYVQEVDESAAKPDWIFDTAVRTVTLTADQTASVTFENTQQGRLKLIKSMPDGGSPAGWIFDIYRKSDNTHIGTFTSGTDGTILTGYLLPGEYLVQEQLDPDSGYWCEGENPRTVTIEAGRTAEVTFVNRLKSGEIAIMKVDVSGDPLAGAEFLLEWSADGTSWRPVVYSAVEGTAEGSCTSPGLRDGRLISDETGLVRFTGLHPDRLYRLTETAAPEGYQLLAGTAFEGSLSSDPDMIVELTVVNVPVFKLPDTGSMAMMYLPLLLSAAYILCAGSMMILRRKAIRKE